MRCHNLFQKICFIMILEVMAKSSFSDEINGNNIKNHVFDLGAGYGLDYGGFGGVKLAYILPFPHISIFGAAGVQVKGFGWNAGTTFHILPENNKYFFRPNVKIMYGINRSTIVFGASKYNKMFTGFTPGVGFEFMFGRKKANGFDFDLNIPISSQKFKDHLDVIDNDPAVGRMTMLAVAISIGYHHEF